MSRYIRYEEKDSGYLIVFKTAICNVVPTKCPVWVKSLNNRFRPNTLAHSTKTHSKKCNAINRKRDPVTWWNAEGIRNFPKLFTMATKYLSIPATSVPSERLFSKTGQILSDRRTRLQPKYTDMMSVICSNKNK